MSKAYIKQFEQKLPHNVQQTEAVSAFRHCKLFRAAERFALQYTLLLYLFENHVLTQEETTSSPVQHVVQNVTAVIIPKHTRGDNVFPCSALP